jgi:hypothetical protein
MRGHGIYVSESSPLFLRLNLRNSSFAFCHVFELRKLGQQPTRHSNVNSLQVHKFPSNRLEMSMSLPFTKPHIEDYPRRVRVLFAGVYIVDTKKVKLV